MQMQETRSRRQDVRQTGKFSTFCLMLQAPHVSSSSPQQTPTQPQLAPRLAPALFVWNTAGKRALEQQPVRPQQPHPS